MDMSNLPAGEIVVSHVDVKPINDAIKHRAETLASQLPSGPAEQLISDMEAYECTASANGSQISFKPNITESYLINYLKNHSTPVTGGNGGTAHNVDGSTYQSKVPRQLWGQPLPWLELPILQGEDEVYHIIELMAKDAVENAIANSTKDISEAVKPIVSQQIREALGGGAS